jgi:hypothetical protein
VPPLTDGFLRQTTLPRHLARNGSSVKFLKNQKAFRFGRAALGDGDCGLSGMAPCADRFRLGSHAVDRRLGVGGIYLWDPKRRVSHLTQAAIVPAAIEILEVLPFFLSSPRCPLLDPGRLGYVTLRRTQHIERLIDGFVHHVPTEVRRKWKSGSQRMRVVEGSIVSQGPRLISDLGYRNCRTF